MDSSVSLKDQIWFLRVCRHVSNGLYSGTALPTHSIRLFPLNFPSRASQYAITFKTMSTAEPELGEEFEVLLVGRLKISCILT
jgi:hypothetical protein